MKIKIHLDQKACVDASRIFFGGKANLYVNEDASINVRDVAVCLQAYIFKNKKSNCSRIIDFGDTLNSYNVHFCGKKDDV